MWKRWVRNVIHSFNQRSGIRQRQPAAKNIAINLNDFICIPSFRINVLMNSIQLSRRSGEYGRWSTRQCFKRFENQSHIKCACYHFTNFAVLFKISDDEQVRIYTLLSSLQKIVFYLNNGHYLLIRTYYTAENRSTWR